MLRTLIPRGSFEWKISGVKNKISQNKDTYSDPFYVGLYKFQGSIQWNITEHYVGLFLHIMKGEWDDTLKWPLRYKRSMALINQLDSKDGDQSVCELCDESYSNPVTYHMKAEHPGCGQAAKGWGIQQQRVVLLRLVRELWIRG